MGSNSDHTAYFCKLNKSFKVTQLVICRTEFGCKPEPKPVVFKPLSERKKLFPLYSSKLLVETACNKRQINSRKTNRCLLTLLKNKKSAEEILKILLTSLSGS